MLLLSSIPRRKRFRISIRAVFIVVTGIATYTASILFEEKLYLWAAIPAVLILIMAIIDFVLGDVLTEKRYPVRTEAILGNYENKVQNVHNQLLGQLDAAIKSLKGCDPTKVNGTLHLLVELFSPRDDSSDHAFVQVTRAC